LKIAIYDPPMCCSSGLCGPTLDPALVKMNAAVQALKKKGVEAERFNLSQQIKEVMSDKTVAELIQKKSSKILPIKFLQFPLLQEEIKGPYHLKIATATFNKMFRRTS